MSIYSELNKTPSRRDLLSFGLIVLGGFGILGLVFRYYLVRPDAALYLWIAGASVFVLSFIPPVGRVLYILWMGFGLTLGFFTSPVIMGIVYLLIIVPVGIVFRIRRRDMMRRTLDPKAASYWEDYPGTDDPARYIRQF